MALPDEIKARLRILKFLSRGDAKASGSFRRPERSA